MSPNLILRRGILIILTPCIFISPSNSGTMQVISYSFLNCGINCDRNLAIPSHLGKKQSLVMTNFFFQLTAIVLAGTAIAVADVLIKNRFEEIEWGSHGFLLNRAGYQYNAIQTPLTEKYFDYL